MPYFFALVVFTILIFGFVILFGAPFLPSLKQQINSSIDLAGIKKGQTIIDLGCGDGRVLSIAAKNGLFAIGYELNPILVLIAKIKTYKYRHKVTVVWGNFWQAELPRADVIFVFLVNQFMPKLETKINAYKFKPIKVVSVGYQIPKKPALTSKNGVFLYEFKN